MNSKFMQPYQAAKFLGVSKSTLYRWSKEGLLVPHKVKGKLYYYMPEVEQFILSR